MFYLNFYSNYTIFLLKEIKKKRKNKTTFLETGESSYQRMSDNQSLQIIGGESSVTKGL